MLGIATFGSYPIKAVYDSGKDLNLAVLLSTEYSNKLKIFNLAFKVRKVVVHSCQPARNIAHLHVSQSYALLVQNVIIHDVTNENELISALDDLLCHPMTPGGTLRDRVTGAVWQYHIGGDAHEA